VGGNASQAARDVDSKRGRRGKGYLHSFSPHHSPEVNGVREVSALACFLRRGGGGGKKGINIDPLSIDSPSRTG